VVLDQRIQGVSIRQRIIRSRRCSCCCSCACSCCCWSCCCFCWPTWCQQNEQTDQDQAMMHKSTCKLWLLFLLLLFAYASSDHMLFFQGDVDNDSNHTNNNNKNNNSKTRYLKTWQHLHGRQSFWTQKVRSAPQQPRLKPRRYQTNTKSGCGCSSC